MVLWPISTAKKGYLLVNKSLALQSRGESAQHAKLTYTARKSVGGKPRLLNNIEMPRPILNVS